jgi:hypothetical protein
MSIFGKLFGRLSTEPNRDIAGRAVKSPGWKIEENKLIREYKFSQLPPPETETYLRIQCSLSRQLNGFVSIHLNFCLRPYLYLMPDRLPFESHIVGAPFALSLFASGSGAGTQESPIFRGEMSGVAAYEGEPGTAVLFTDIQSTVVNWIKAISTGEELIFAIVDQETDNTKLRLRLPNDREFQKLYENLPAN